MISTGGDYDSTLGQAVPGFSIFHYGLDLIAVVSTGEDVWELKVNTEIIRDSNGISKLPLIPPSL